MHKCRLLIIDDDRQAVLALKDLLNTDYHITYAYGGKPGLRKLELNDYDLVLLDLHLSDTSGLVVCRKIKQLYPELPIIIISADAQSDIKINLYDSDIDDYIVKPAHALELKARIKNLLRRNHHVPKANRLKYSTVLLDGAIHSATREGKDLGLRRKEFLILECLLLNSGKAVARPTIVRHAWNSDSPNWTNAVDVHIKHLRDKLDKPFDSNLIQTVHGIGYKLQDPALSD